jgi:hypothetical protein
VEIEREWTGDAVAVRRAVELARERGQLVDEQWLPATPGEAAVKVVLRPGALPAGQRQRQRSVPWRWIAGATALVGSAVGTGWLLWLAANAAVGWLVAHAAHIAGGLAVVALAWWLLGQAGACPGVHCPGCGCR